MLLKLLYCIACVTCVLGLVGCSTRTAPPAAQPVAAAPHRSGESEPVQTEAAPRGETASSERGRQVAQLFDRLLDAVKDEDASAVAALADPRRMFQEIERQQLFVNVLPAEKTAVRIAFTAWLGDGLLEEAQTGGWKKLEIQRQDFDDDTGEARVTVRITRRDNAGRLAMRFWLRQSSGSWKVFDWESAESFLRASTHIGAMLAVLRTGPEMEGYQRLLYASRQVAAGDFAGAESTLDESPDAALPDFLEAGRWLLYAHAKFAERDARMAKRCLQAARDFNADILAMPKLLAACEALLGDFESSLIAAQEARDTMGGDAEIYAQIGDGLAQTGQSAAAADAYRQGLSLDHDSLECLLGLSTVLGPERKEEIGQRFLRLSDPTADFEQVIQTLLNWDDSPAANAVVEAFKTYSSDQRLIALYEAEIALADEQFVVAEERFKSLVADSQTPRDRLFFEARLVDSLLAAGKPLTAYRAGTDKRETLVYIADQLIEQENADDLLAVASEHEKQFPEDISVYLYKGSAHYFNAAYEQAETELARGMALAETEAIRERFRQFRVLARFKDGVGLSAYSDIRPREKTFAQLASLFLTEQQADELVQLVALHRESAPADPLLDVWEAEAKLLEDDYRGAAASINQAIAATADQESRRELGNKLLDIHLTANTPLDGYAQSRDADRAFRYLSERLLAKEDGQSLIQLVEARRRHLAEQDIVEGAGYEIGLDYYYGRGKLLMQEYSTAADVLSRALDDATSVQQREAIREQLVLAKVKQGQGLEAYQQIAPKSATYDQLARYYAGESDASGLLALVEAHAQHNADDPTLPLWRAEVHWLNQEYDQAADLLIEQRTVVLADPLNRGRFEDRLVRSLVRAKRWEDARREARLSTSRDGDPWFEAIVAGASGNVDQTETVLRACVEGGYTAEDFYADEDLGPALRSEALRRLRSEFADPAAAN